MKHERLREQVLLANRATVEAGLVRLTFGNVSGVERNAGVMAIKPSGVPYDALTPETIVVLELRSGRVMDGDYSPSSDTPTHLALYRAFEQVGGIVHTHSLYATSWAQAKVPIPCLGTTHADHFHGAVPVTRLLRVEEIKEDYERWTGEVIIETIRNLALRPLEMPAVLVASHGPFTWGTDPMDAVENAVALELVAQIAIYSMQIDAALGPCQGELLEKHYLRKHGPSAYYGQPR